MGKRKRELAGSSGPTATLPDSNHHLQQAHQQHQHLNLNLNLNQQQQTASASASPHNGDQQAPLKRNPPVSRASLNFSIESIMSSAAGSGIHGSAKLEESLALNDRVRSASPTGFELPEESQAQQQPQSHHHQQQQHHHHHHLYEKKRKITQSSTCLPAASSLHISYGSDLDDELSCSSPQASSVSSGGHSSRSGSRNSSSASSSLLTSRSSTPISPGGVPARKPNESAPAKRTRREADMESLGSPRDSPGVGVRKSAGEKIHLNQGRDSPTLRSAAAAAAPNSATSNSTRSSSASGASGGTATNGSSSSTTNQLLRPKLCKDPRLAPFQCQLDNLELWNRFHNLDTEMIITKQGRRMFPPVRVTFSVGLGGNTNYATNAGANSTAASGEQQTCTGIEELNPREKYQVLMDILPYDGKRYRYAYHKSSWQQAGKADPPSPTKLFLHPDGPFTLEQLKRQVISFEKIKLTNNDANKHGYIVLNSMHKYQPRIHLVLWRGAKEGPSLANAPITQLEQEIHKTFIFSETIFTAVTAYQNHSITKLKIDSNPFAKGFRDSSRLTDLELESMQDLMSEGQCPFSPPRAPPHGFPHFLFAAAQQAAAAGAGQLEDPASTLLRERTIMALDSFLQQQQQQSASPSRPGLANCAGHQTAGQPGSNLPSQAPSGPPPPYSSIPFGNFLMSPQPPQQQQKNSNATPAQQVPANHLEQLIMQQQQQFAAAAAMAAAAAAHNHPLHSLFNPTSGALTGNLSQQLPLSGKHTHAGATRAGNQSCSPVQLSPNFTSVSNKSPLTNQPGTIQSAPAISHLQQQHYHHQLGAQQQQSNLPGNFAQQPPGGAPTTNHYAFHPQHLHAMMAAHHQHQMAAQMAQMQQQLEQSAAAANRQLVTTSHLDPSNNNNNNNNNNHHHHLPHHLSHQLGDSAAMVVAASAGISNSAQSAAKSNL